jgi:uncharacterized protein YecT (DUF1311 family)
MTMNFPRVFALLLLLAAFAAPAHAKEHPSFDCDKASTTDEKLICGDHKLAEIDRRMGEIYMAARATLSETERKALLEAQRNWLGGHDAACGITGANNVPDEAAECFIKRYRARIAELLPMLSRGNVIREVRGKEPWMVETEASEEDKYGAGLAAACAGIDPGPCCFPSTISVIANDPKYTTYVINGKRHILFSAHYTTIYPAPPGTYDPEESSPTSTEKKGSCTALWGEDAPGSGDFSVPTDSSRRWDGIFSMSELLSGRTKWDANGHDFASDLHTTLMLGDAITLAPAKGEPRRYQWDAAKKAYVPVR